jgi:metal-responsive CopG/Arc/MetJ family transcriptional regulator
MGKSAKIAISLPQAVFDAAEKRRLYLGESRSEFFRRAVENMLQSEREAALVKEYIQGYQQTPESAAEIKAVYNASIEALSQEPW